MLFFYYLLHLNMKYTEFNVKIADNDRQKKKSMRLDDNLSCINSHNQFSIYSMTTPKMNKISLKTSFCQRLHLVVTCWRMQTLLNWSSWEKSGMYTTTSAKVCDADRSNIRNSLWKYNIADYITISCPLFYSFGSVSILYPRVCNALLPYDVKSYMKMSFLWKSIK